MVLGFSVARVLFIWATVFICQVDVITDTFVTASIVPTRLEREALLNTGWWNNSREKASNHSDHCKWAGIVCNLNGSIIRISLSGVNGIRGKLDQFNFSCFPNLESFRIWYSNISGNIPSEIGALSKLQILDLSHNNLTGKLPNFATDCQGIFLIDTDPYSLYTSQVLSLQNLGIWITLLSCILAVATSMDLSLQLLVIWPGWVFWICLLTAL